MLIKTGIDTIGANATNIPLNTPVIGAYVSGTGPIPWTASDLSDFAKDQVVRIYQGYGTYPGVGNYDMIDVETGAVTIAQAASEVEKRVLSGYNWTIIYGTDSTISECALAIQALGNNIWAGHVYSWLADWDLSEAEATAKLGTQIHGMTCIGVQWASPSSNPNTIAPGTTKTLRELNLDLNVVDVSLLPLPGKAVSPLPPVQPAIHGLVVYESSPSTYTSKDVTSTDGGNTWA